MRIELSNILMQYMKNHDISTLSSSQIYNDLNLPNYITLTDEEAEQLLQTIERLREKGTLITEILAKTN